MEVGAAAFYCWTYESTRNESPRSRYQFISYSTYPMNSLWLKDLVLDAARTSRFRYDIKSKEFYILMFKTQAKARYRLQSVGAFKISFANGWPEIRSAQMTGEDSKSLNYEWKYSDDPYDFPSPPNLAPTTPDPIKSPMFPGGAVHHQYPRITHSSHKAHLIQHLNPTKPHRWYQGVSTRVKRHGMPIPPAPSASVARLVRPKRSKQKAPAY